MAELLTVSTALPDNRVTAAEAKAHLSDFLPPGMAGRFRRAVDASRNQTRYSVMPMEQLLRLNTLESRNQEYGRAAVTLGEIVARDALLQARVGSDAVQTVICVSATGYMMPSLETHLIDRLRLNPTCRRVPMVQLGCSGGVASIGLAAELLGAGSPGNVLVVSVELPSLSLQTAEPSPTDIISSIQFGDGAAAGVLSGEQGTRGPEVLATRSVLFPESIGRDGIRLTQTGLRLMQQRGLPHLIRTLLPGAMREFLAAHGLRREDISFWVVHPRGPQIIEAVQRSLDLSDQDVAPSRAVWERCGNMISSSVFFILRQLQSCAPPSAGTLGVMLAVGAGITCEMALLRSQGWLSGAH